MTGLVVVSHSRALAEAAVALAHEMAPPEKVRLEVAAGMPDGSTGTDATQIADAIGRADDEQGVVVLMDLGSAVLSAQMALELVDPDVAERVTLSSGPLVEALVVCAVRAAGGADRATVAQESTLALLPKQTQLEE